MTMPDGFKYEGEWKDSVFVSGKFYNPDGSLKYEGTWQDNKFTKGVAYFQAKKFYDGDWKDD